MLANLLQYQVNVPIFSLSAQLRPGPWTPVQPMPGPWLRGRQQADQYGLTSLLRGRAFLHLYTFTP